MLANEVDPQTLVSYAEDDEFWLQQKLDGHRILLNCKGDSITALERKGDRSQHNSKFQTAAWLSMLLPFAGKGVIFDGEFLDSILWIFDMPYLEGVITQEDPYEDRLACLEKIFSAAPPPKQCARLVQTAKTTDGKLDLIQSCIANRAEGVMIKDKNARYHCGKTSVILKAKFVKTADLVVTAVNFGGKENAILCAWKNQELVEVGKCSTIGKPKLQPGDIIEVKYLYLGSNSHIVQPRMLKIRTDKESQDCQFSQLIYTDKTVLI